MMKRTFKKLMAAAGSFEHYRGYHYLCQAVSLVLENPERLCNICMENYQPVAKMNHTSRANVHRDIRTLIANFWTHGGKELFVKWTGCTRWYYEKPYPKEFIGTIAQLIRESQEDSSDTALQLQVHDI